MPTSAETARAYHQITKHHVRRQARSLGYLDWDSQPDPFRRFEGAALVPLSHAAAADPAARLLRLALGLTAWKEFEGNRWALRANPSSGNLHPTEGYVVLPPGRRGLPAGVLHYAPREHALELRCSLAGDAARALGERLPAGGFLVGLTSILWREAWKYGERAFRYCALDTGHALGALDYAAACVGMRAAAVGGWSDDDVARLLGTDRAADFEALDPWEHEQPELLVAVVPESAPHPGPLAPNTVLEALRAGTWHGKPNALSEEHHEWDVIHATAAATRRAASGSEDRGEAATAAKQAQAHITTEQATTAEHERATDRAPSTTPPARPLAPERLQQCILQRRSAVSMVPTADLPLATFARLLDATLQRTDCPPWRAWPEPTRAHLLLFVHRVEGLPRGLYLLERNPTDHVELQATLSAQLEWHACDELAAHGGAHLRLFRLRTGHTEAVARAVACQQDIAADGAFSLGMLTRHASVIEADASAYRRGFWECGVIGQALYIEAEAAGQNATGIGCYFDDSVHELVGLRGDEWQILYHFTIGTATHDDRLQTYPPYGVADPR